MESARCPYCREENTAGGAKCISCGEAFPWSADVDRLRDEVKEREVNRGRATFTLIDELFSAAKGGKPVSVAAMKGFAFAWLFPRTMIVVGSVITGLVLIAQTLIIYRQTNLLEGQTVAARFAQAEVLRARIPEIERQAEAMRHMAAAAQQAWMGVAAPLQISPCSECEAMTFEAAYLSDTGTSARTHVTARLQRLRFFHEEVSTASTNGGTVAENLDRAYALCGLERAVASNGGRTFDAVATLQALEVPHAAPASTGESGVAEYRTPVPSDRRFHNFMKPTDLQFAGGYEHIPASVTVSAFWAQAKQNLRTVVAALDDAEGRCVRTMLSDRIALGKIQEDIAPQDALAPSSTLVPRIDASGARTN